MIDPFDLYNDFKALVNTFQGGFYQPQTTFIRSANNINQELWVKYTNESEKSQEARDNLLWALRSNNIIVSAENSFYGKLAPPSDYGRFASAKILWEKVEEKVVCRPSISVNKGKCIIGKKTKNGVVIDTYDTTITQAEMTEAYFDKLVESDVQLIDEQRWSACLKHETKFPTIENPKMRQIDKGWNVAPRQVSMVILNYYIKAVDAIFSYTTTPGNIQTGSGDEIVYNKDKSTPFPWPDDVKNEFLWRLGERFSYFTREQFLAQVTVQKAK
jgi:hypothetical protein